MSPQELLSDSNFEKLHTSAQRGYVSRKIEGRVEPYVGKFGQGYKLLTPRRDTTRFCRVTYFIRK